MHLLTALAFSFLLQIQVSATALQQSSPTAQEVIALFNLQPNVEKGYFQETFVDARVVEGNRPASTAIYYLLEGSVGWAEWHRVDAVEVW